MKPLFFVVASALVLCGIALTVTTGWTEQPSSKEKSATQKALSGDLIFADGFESGNTSAWSSGAPTHCPAPTVTLPLPVAR